MIAQILQILNIILVLLFIYWLVILTIVYNYDRKIKKKILEKLNEPDDWEEVNK